MSARGLSDAARRLRAFERFGSVLGLERVTELARRLGDPQDALRVIHVTGTNGKGSVCRYIYSVLREHGYKAGIYTSPFVTDFRERMEFDGERITEAEMDRHVAEVCARAADMVADGFESPTEFEVLTAVAFLYFRDKNPDFTILEVGLGGKGDSTNIVKEPLVTVITSVSLDHTDRLGETTAEIALDKAGIIKPGCPVVSAAADADAARVIARVAYERRAPLIDADRLKPRGLVKSRAGYRFDVTVEGRVYGDIETSMPGDHQVRNAICALRVIDRLRATGEIATDGEKLRRAIKSAVQPGRFEIVPSAPEGPAFVLDGAHNEAGADAMARTAADLFPGARTLVVLGVLADKRLAPMLACFDRVASAYIATEPPNERRLPAAELCETAVARGKPCEAIPDCLRAVRTAFARRGEYDLIVVSGSLYLIGAVREELYEKAVQGSAVL